MQHVTEGHTPVDVDNVVEHVVPGLAIEVEVGVLRQVHGGGLVGCGLYHQLQHVIVVQAVGGSHVQVAREALQSLSHLSKGKGHWQKCSAVHPNVTNKYPVKGPVPGAAHYKTGSAGGVT